MIICSCNVISDHDIREAVVSSDVELCSTAQVYNCLGRLVHCGLCSRSVRRILQKRRAGFAGYRGFPEHAAPRSVWRRAGALVSDHPSTLRIARRPRQAI
jgi:bacterioferritin-associated ferredoxin